MENIIPELLTKTLSISIILSIFEMTLIQKIKTLIPLKKKYQVILINIIITFILGPLFLIYFFKVNIINTIWISLFTFIGAPTLYEALRKQTIIKYNPKSLTEINKETK